MASTTRSDLVKEGQMPGDTVGAGIVGSRFTAGVHARVTIDAGQAKKHGVCEEEFFHNGFPQEDDHFIAYVRGDLRPLETGEDGRAVREILMAAYESARTGRKVPLPFHGDDRRPIDLWKA
jgi:predicted dehydrogenase